MEKLITASGVEDKGLLPEVTSEFVGVGSAAFVESVGRSVFNKKARGDSILKSFATDASQGIAKVTKKGVVRDSLKKIIKLKLKID